MDINIILEGETFRATLQKVDKEKVHSFLSKHKLRSKYNKDLNVHVIKKVTVEHIEEMVKIIHEGT